MRNKYCFLILMLVVNILAGCELHNKNGEHQIIYFNNNSDKDVLITWEPYPESICSWIPQTLHNESSYKIGAKSSGRITVYWWESWENRISQYSSEMITYFVLDYQLAKKLCNDTVDTWDYSGEDGFLALDTYLTEQTVLKKYSYSIDDLEWLDWTITYP